MVRIVAIDDEYYIRMPFMDGLELIHTISASHISCLVIILSGLDEFEYAH